MIAAAKSEDAENPTLSGDDAFTLYDTYGFSLDITTDVADEAGYTVDVDGFATAMEETARETSPATRASPSTSPRAISSPPSRTNSPNPPGSPATEARGGGREDCAMVRDGERVDQAAPGDAVDVVLDATPFYAEGGGQIGDEGARSRAAARSS